MKTFLALSVVLLSACGERPPGLGDACTFPNDAQASTCASDGVSYLVCRDGAWRFDYACAAPTRCDWPEGTTGPACR